MVLCRYFNTRDIAWRILCSISLRSCLTVLLFNLDVNIVSVTLRISSFKISLRSLMSIFSVALLSFLSLTESWPLSFSSSRGKERRANLETHTFYFKYFVNASSFSAYSQIEIFNLYTWPRKGAALLPFGKKVAQINKQRIEDLIRKRMVTNWDWILKEELYKETLSVIGVIDILFYTELHCWISDTTYLLTLKCTKGLRDKIQWTKRKNFRRDQFVLSSIFSVCALWSYSWYQA